MKFTFYYEDASPDVRKMESSACCDVTAGKHDQGTENIEHDVPKCPEGTPPEQCIYEAESLQPIAYHNAWNAHKFVDLVFAAPHLHWAGISIELIDHQTNQTICEVHRTQNDSAGVMYGHGSNVGNEEGYLVGLIPCKWAGSKAPRFRRDHLLRTRSVYNASMYHTGVMSLWLMQVAAVPHEVVV